MTINRDNTLTVQHLLNAVRDGRVSADMPIGVVMAGLAPSVFGICAFELHTYRGGEKVLVIHGELSRRKVCEHLGETSAEVGL
jgi:hypothetical protein